jgi:hypothetical protein
MALVVLVALLVAGLAHATRLCGIDRHATAPAADAVRCPAHHAAEVAPVTDDGRSSSATPAEAPPRERAPSCCTSGTSVAALPGARSEIARDVALQTLAAIAVGGPLLSGAEVRVTPGVRTWRALAAGPRRHLVHRILLI